MKAESFGPDPEADGLPSPAAQAPADATGSPRSRRLMSAGWIVSAIGAAGTGALILALVSNVDALTLVGTGGFAMVALVGAGLIQRGRSARRGAPVVVPASESDMTPLGRRVRYPVEFVVGELLPPPPSSSVAHSASFGTPLPPPPPGVRPQASPLQVRIPDDAAGPVAAEPVAVDEPVVDEPVVDEPVVVDAPILVPLVPEPLAAVGRAPAESPLVPDQERAMASLSTVLHDTGNNVLDQYRQWVLEQALGDTEFHRVDIDANHRDLFMLSSCGVATLLAWLHEQHRATYTVDTWIDEILPGQGIEIDDRELAIELLIAAALYAGGIHTAPTARLREYRADELVTAMATVHVGLLRLYCGIGQRHPAVIVGRQFDDTPFAN